MYMNVCVCVCNELKAAHNFSTTGPRALIFHMSKVKVTYFGLFEKLTTWGQLFKYTKVCDLDL